VVRPQDNLRAVFARMRAADVSQLPVVGSGSCPACTQRVEKSSWFDLVFTA